MTNIDLDYQGQGAPPHPDEVIAGLAAAQAGVVARRQLLERGVTRNAIDDRLKTGHLHPIHRGVYAAGHPSLVALSRRHAAWLAVGPDARISHRTAADEWGLRPDNGFVVDVTAPRRARAHKGVTVHQGRLGEEDKATLRGLPVTNWPRTLLDLAPLVPAHHLTKALERADKLDLLDVRALDDVCARNNGHHGIGALRRASYHYDPRHHQTRSDLERDALPVLDALGLARPEINAFLGPYAFDLYWPVEGVVVELDSWEQHRTRGQFETDRARDRWLAARGLLGLRFTWRQVHAGALRELVEILALRRVRAA